MPTRRSKDSYSNQEDTTRLNNIKIVLVRTFHPGNIGSVARAMKTMGLSKLVLVAPKADFPSEEASKMALSADDVLERAEVVPDLVSAISDCKLVIASTARIRGHDLPELSPEETAKNLINTSESSPVALVLGPERMGLHNDDIKHASHRVTIPTSPQMQSLNIAAAAQTLCYEIYKHHIIDSDETVISKTPGTLMGKVNRENLADREDHERFYAHLEQTLKSTGFIKPGHGGPIMLRLRTLFARAEPDQDEMNILRAILASIEKKKN